MSVDIERLLASKEIVITAGSGGVGKTTMAAALGALAANRLHKRVLVLTVDPARRLATAMGLDEMGSEAVQIDTDRFASGGDSSGELWVAMLDTKASWDALVRTHAPDAETRDAILANPLYQNVTGRFVQSHDYIAMEKLHELHSSGEWDLLVVDTPPSRNALDLLDAPEKMREFFSGRLIRWMTVPVGSRFMYRASRPFQLIADRILGGQFVQDIAEFFMLLRAMEDGFVARAAEVERTLAAPRTSFAVVTTPEPGPVREAGRLIKELQKRSLGLGVIIANRTLPAALSVSGALAASNRMSAADPETVAGLAETMGRDAVDVARVTVIAGETARRFRPMALAEAETLSVLPVDLVTTVPALDADVTDMNTVEQLAELLR